MAQIEVAVTSELSAGAMSAGKQNIFKRSAENCCIAVDQSICAALIWRKAAFSLLMRGYRKTCVHLSFIQEHVNIFGCTLFF